MKLFKSLLTTVIFIITHGTANAVVFLNDDIKAKEIMVEIFAIDSNASMDAVCDTHTKIAKVASIESLPYYFYYELELAPTPDLGNLKDAKFCVGSSYSKWRGSSKPFYLNRDCKVTFHGVQEHEIELSGACSTKPS